MTFKFHRPKADACAGFPSAPPKRQPDTIRPPAKRGPSKSKTQQAASALRTDEERKADKLARATAFNPAGFNFTLNPTPSKTIGAAGSRFATA